MRQREAAEKRDKQEDRAEENVAAFATGAMMATEAQIQAFATKLDRYETMTVEALLTNEEAMDAVRLQIATMLQQAYTLEDGRRVFRTEDGSQVFDEFGEEVGLEFVSPDDIDPSLPTWEQYSAARDQEQALAVERQALLEFQERLDESRELIDREEVAVSDLDALDAELEALMPPAMYVAATAPNEADVNASQAARSDPAVQPFAPSVP